AVSDICRRVVRARYGGEGQDVRITPSPEGHIVRRALGLATMIIAGVLQAVPAQADDGIPLVGELPVKATTACTDRAPGPYEDLDVWRFSIKGQGQFRSLTLEFQKANGQPDTRTIEQTGTEAWIAVDPGETLVS